MDEQRVREIVREELKAAAATTATQVERTYWMRIEHQVEIRVLADYHHQTLEQVFRYAEEALNSCNVVTIGVD